MGYCKNYITFNNNPVNLSLLKPHLLESEIIQAIKAARIAAGYKLINVANGIGVSEGTVSKIETGMRPLTIAKFIKICEFLKISSGQLLLIIEHKYNSNLKLPALSSILINYFFNLPNIESELGIDKKELLCLLKKIEEYYDNVKI